MPRCCGLQTWRLWHVLAAVSIAHHLVPVFFCFPAGGQEGMDFRKGCAAQRLRREWNPERAQRAILPVVACDEYSSCGRAEQANVSRNREFRFRTTLRSGRDVKMRLRQGACLRPFCEPPSPLHCTLHCTCAIQSMCRPFTRAIFPGQNGDSERIQIPAVSEQLPRGLPEADVRSRERPRGVLTDLSRRVLYILRAMYVRRHAK